MTEEQLININLLTHTEQFEHTFSSRRIFSGLINIFCILPEKNKEKKQNYEKTQKQRKDSFLILMCEFNRSCPVTFISGALCVYSPFIADVYLKVQSIFKNTRLRFCRLLNYRCCSSECF